MKRPVHLAHHTHKGFNLINPAAVFLPLIVFASIFFPTNANGVDKGVEDWFVCEVIAIDFTEQMKLDRSDALAVSVAFEVKRFFSWSNGFDPVRFEELSELRRLVGCVYLDNGGMAKTAGSYSLRKGGVYHIMASLRVPHAWGESDPEIVDALPFSVPVLLMCESKSQD